ncbi:LysR family transcriptional regulator [Perlucidibaca piscinae]|uniref:LysR family transcriptional regulator n=1 Tax=Perlucidibaca piscinae TaxID=392589 RepID=UPI0003B36FC3|nr:LysR substrate-binding domain-containing protein [Perlucidibaca piscinae]
MELRHLRYFVAVAEELHFQRAAKRLHIEQSPLSRAIKDLENQLGVQLLERTTRCTKITRAGQIFLMEARRILAAVEQAKSAIKSASLGYSQQLRIALSDGVPMQRVTELIAKQRRMNEEIDIRLYEMSATRLLQAIQSREVDLGLSLNSFDDQPTVSSSRLWHDGLCALMPASHPMSRGKGFSLAELTHYPLILPEARGTNSLHQAIYRLVRQHDRTLNVVQRTDSVSLMMSLVKAGIGIGFATQAQLRGHDTAEVVIKPLGGFAPVITTYMLHHAQHLPDTVLPFMKLLEDDEPEMPSDAELA